MLESLYVLRITEDRATDKLIDMVKSSPAKEINYEQMTELYCRSQKGENSCV